MTYFPPLNSLHLHSFPNMISSSLMALNAVLVWWLPNLLLQPSLFTEVQTWISIVCLMSYLKYLRGISNLIYPELLPQTYFSLSLSQRSKWLHKILQVSEVKYLGSVLDSSFYTCCLYTKHLENDMMGRGVFTRSRGRIIKMEPSHRFPKKPSTLVLN